MVRSLGPEEPCQQDDVVAHCNVMSIVTHYNSYDGVMDTTARMARHHMIQLIRLT